MKRLSYLFAAGLLIGGIVSVTPVSAQAGNGNSGNSGCNMIGGTNTGGNTTGGNQTTTNRSGSAGTLAGLINVMVQDVQVMALNNVEAQLTDIANNPNVSVVCVTDALNQNDVHILQDILNGSPILSQDLNQSLNNNTILSKNALLNNVLSSSNLTILGINFQTGQVYVAPTTTL